MKGKTGLIFVFILILVLIFLLNKKTITISTAEQLEEIFKYRLEGLEFRLKPGIYNLNPISIIDSTCGNCEDPDNPIPATAGVIISGKNLKIIGPENRSAIIYTNAGYGIYIKDCENCVIENLIITGGIRDTSGFASDAAIVVKNSNVIIQNNIICRNFGDSILISKNIVGIMGICGRENSYLEILNNEILQNSWDGIALYRDAEAHIKGNIIDGIDKAGGRIPRGGRGVAIGVTWNAKAVIENNLIKRYWKGIGLFVDARGEIRNNIIEDLLTWGISLWDAGKGKPIGIIENNIIYNLGAMGAAITSSVEENPGHFKGNIIIKTGQNSAYDSPDYYGFQCALAEHSVPENFEIKDNIFFNNRKASEDLPDYDISEEEFFIQIENRKEEFIKHPFIESSIFYIDFFIEKETENPDSIQIQTK